MSAKEKLKFKLPASLGFAAFIIIMAGVMYAQGLVSQLLMSLFVSIICFQPIAWLQKRKFPKGIAIALVFMATIGIFVIIGEIISSSLTSFSADAAEYESRLEQMGADALGSLEEMGITIPIDQFSSGASPSKVLSFTAGFLGELSGVMGTMFTVFFLVLFLLMEIDSFDLKAKAITSSSKISIAYLDTIINNIRHYLSIKTMTSLLTGAIVWIGLTITGVDYAIMWALIAFLLNYIPNIGSIIAAIPAILFAVIQLGYVGALWTMVIFLIANMVVGNVVEPKMMGKGLGLSTFVVFLSLIFWGFVLGTVGMFLSVPLTMTIKIVLEQKPETKWIAVLLGTDEDARNFS